MELAPPQSFICMLPQTHLHLPCVNNFFPLLLPACNFPKNNQGSSNNHYGCLIMVAQIGDIMLIKGTIRGMMVKTTKAKMALVKHTSQTGVEVLFKSFLGCLAQGWSFIHQADLNQQETWLHSHLKKKILKKNLYLLRKERKENKLTIWLIRLILREESPLVNQKSKKLKTLL